MNVEVIAHRGLSGHHPESTRGAYLAAIELARATGRSLQLECDVHFSADRELIILHDLTLRRTARRRTAAADLTVSQLRAVDFGRWRGAATTEDRALITLPELCALVHDARSAGVDVGLAIETKHPNPSGLDVDRAVLELITAYGWTDATAPVRVISFHLPAVEFWSVHRPDLARSLLVEKTLGPWADGVLPYDTDTIGIELALLRTDPDYARRVVGRGHHLHVWTPNTEAELRWCLDLGATGLTTDYAERALAATG